VRANHHRAHCQGWLGLHECAYQFHVFLQLAEMRGGELAQRFDSDGELATCAALVPNPTDHAVDEQHRIIASLTGRSERAARSQARVQQLARLARDDERVEVRQQPDPLIGLPRGGGVAGNDPAPLALQLDGLQVVSQFVEQLDGVSGRDIEPSGEVLWRSWAVGVQVAHDKGAQTASAVLGLEASQPAVRVGVGHCAAPVWSKAEHAAVRGRAC
jgi:hypothetical protein